MNRLYVLAAALCMVAVAECATAATITVRKDGTGDFGVIQPALDAAASGDTILIGPGEFTELTPSFIPGYAWDVEVCAYVRVPNLTIIGAGKGQTVIGPTTYYGDGLKFTPKCVVWLEGSERFISGVTIRNGYEGIHAINGPLYIDDCEFVENGGYGIIWHSSTSGGWVRNSEFYRSSWGAKGVSTIGSGSNILIENCVFDNVYNNIVGTTAISFIRCEMKNERIGVQISDGAHGVLRDCEIHDCAGYGVALEAGEPHCEIYDSRISGDVSAVVVRGGASLFSTNTEFSGGSASVLRYLNAGPVEINNSHLIRNGPYFTDGSQTTAYGDIVWDLTQNYWGTTNLADIAEGILDSNDDPARHVTIHYEPIFEQPVSQETKSWGDVKAMFR